MVNAPATAHPSLFSDAVRRDPYAHYARMRGAGRVHHLDPPGLWPVPGYDDVVSVLRRPEVFSSAVMAPADPVLLGADPPGHDRARAVVRAALSRDHLARVEALAATIAARLVEPIARAGGGDVVGALAGPLPIEVLAALLGVTGSRLEDFRRWSRAVIAVGTGAPVATDADPARTVAELERFLAAELEQRAAGPADDVLAALVRGEPRGALPAHEALSVAKLLLVAGTETTTSLIANTVVSLLRHPDALAAVQRDHALISAALEETLRYESPVQFVYRLTREDTDLGTAIPAGAVVMAMVGSANRDERRFADPDVFRLDRPASRHLAFGVGPHACLGALLARAEARAALHALLRVAPALTAAEDLDDLAWAPSMQLRGPERLHVALGG